MVQALHLFGLLSDGGVHSHIEPYVCSSCVLAAEARRGKSIYSWLS